MANRRECRGGLWYDRDTKLIYREPEGGQPLGPYTFEDATSSLWGLFWRSPLEPFEYPTAKTVEAIVDKLSDALYAEYPTLLLRSVEINQNSGFFGTNPSHPQRLVEAVRLKTERFAPGGWIFQAYRDGWDKTLERIKAEFKQAGL